ncbi:MAG: AbrB/MazE/SpoVT family DNA-binding domain-containing protein [Candidatus Saliniplasma sp.]
MIDDIVKMSKKGQLVVPKDIREEEHFNPSDKFIAIPIKDGVIFKKIEIDLEKEYDELKDKVQERFKKEDLSEEEVEKAIEWARGN